MQYKGPYFFSKLTEFVRKNVKCFVTFFVVSLVSLFCVSLYHLNHLKSEYNIKQFFPKKHVLLEQEYRVTRHFKLQDKSSLILILENKTDRTHSTWVKPNNIKKLRQFSDSLSQVSNVKKNINLSILQGTFEVGKNLYVGDLFSQVPEKYWSKVISNNPFVKPNLLSADLKKTLVILELSENSPEVISSVQKKIKKLQKEFLPDTHLSFAGIPLIQNDVASLLKSELTRSVLIGLIFFTVILLLIFKNVLGVFVTLFNLVFTNVVCLGTLSYFNVKLDVLLSTLPVLISLITVSLSVHIILRVSNETDYHSSDFSKKLESILLRLKTLFSENLIASVTPAIGFLMLVTSDIGIIQKYGQVVFVSILLTWFLCQIYLIPALLLFPALKLRSWSSKKAIWSLSLLKFKTPIVYFTYFVMFSGLVAFGFLNWNTRLFDDLPKTSRSRINIEKIDRSFGGTIPVSVVVFGGENTWTNPIWLKRMDLMAKEFRKLKSVGSIITSADFFKKPSTRGIRLPASRGEATESLFIYSMADEDPTTSYLNQTYNMSRLDVRLRDLPRHEQDKDISTMTYLIGKYFPGFKYNISGMGITAHQLNADMSKELIFGFWQSIVAIGILLVFIFRSFRWSMVACLPNLVPPLVLISSLSLTQTPIKPSVAIIFSIAIGLAFSNTIYLLGQLKKLVHEHGHLHYLPVKNMLMTEMVPCLVATLLVTSGFVVFAFSYFEMNKIFGVYMIISILAGAFGDLIFLPAFLKKYPYFLLQKKSPKLIKTFNLRTASFFCLAFFIFFKADAKTDVQALLTKTKALLVSEDDSALVTMRIIEKDGSVKERKMQIKRKFNKKNMTLVRMQSPSDLKGTALLSIIDNEEENQWLYLPSTKQVRRIMGQNKKSGVLGSELSTDDLDMATIKGSKAHLVKEIKSGQDTFSVIEIKSKTNETQYSKALILISAKTSLPVRLEYYNAKNTAIKRVDFENYTKIGNVYRAQSIKVRNLVNKRGTDLILSQIKSNSGISDDEFSQRALSKE